MSFNGGVTDTNITCLTFSDEFIYAGSNRGNIFRAPVNSLPLGVENLKTVLPQSFTLQQNYPNPFNPTTLIRFTLNKNSFVALEIYDVHGRRISEPLKNYQPAGSYEIPFSGSNLAGGVYFCRLTVGGLSESIKLVLLK
ncbi:MAG: T9SS type A sorting domain-containing protein [Ignavibacteria bacterium]|nr:T9SS type A sorting domain-containing protein [Ignavibacteria bacterium]